MGPYFGPMGAHGALWAQGAQGEVWCADATNVLSADATDVLCADAADALSADTADALNAADLPPVYSQKGPLEKPLGGSPG